MLGFWRFCPLDALSGFFRRDRFRSHREEGTREQDSGAPELGVRQVLVEIPRGEQQGSDWAEKLQGLSERDADLADGDVVKDVRHGDACDGRKNQGAVNVRADVKRRGDSAE